MIRGTSLDGLQNHPVLLDDGEAIYTFIIGVGFVVGRDQTIAVCFAQVS